jgi:hypothetical protein
MQAAPDQLYPAPPLSFPIAVAKARLCSVSGALAGSGCEAAHTAYDAEVPSSRLPQQRCATHGEIPVAPAALVYGNNAPPSLIPGLDSVPQARVEAVRQAAPATPAYANAPAPAAPPIVLNGRRVTEATPFPAGGGARPYANVSGAERDRTVGAWQNEQGVRVMRAYPPEAAAQPGRLRARPVEPSSEAIADRPIVDHPPVVERDHGDDAYDPNEADRRREAGERRPGLFHRIFGSRR